MAVCNVLPFDHHLGIESPLIDQTGGFLCSLVPFDADAQAVSCLLFDADLGADEVLPVTYALGPPHDLTVVAAGLPAGAAVTLVFGRELADPPIPTPYGPLEVADDAPRRLSLPAANADGASWTTFDVSGFASGTRVVFQALAGSAFAPATTVLVP